MAQTIEAFVGNSLDEAKISPLHIKVISLIAAGYFFDVIDYIVQGSLFPDMMASGFANAGGAALIVSATTFGMFIGTAAQGSSPTGSAGGSSISSIFCCSASSRSSARSPRTSRCWSSAASSPASASAPNSRSPSPSRRIFAQAHPRPHPGDHPFHRRRLRVADRHAVRARIPR